MVNLEEIKNQVKQVIAYSQEIEDPKTDDLIEQWVVAKNTFIKAFGDSAIYEHPEKITFHLDAEERDKRINRFVAKLKTHYNLPVLADFVEKQATTFFDNRVSEEFCCAINGKKILKGAKLSKSFKNFITNPRLLDDVQTDFSTIIQEDKIEGHICLSVHPLDFLSMSENTYNWRSCHALDGEFCAGTLSYLLDACSFLCYVKGDNDVILPHFPKEVLWNNKKWRAVIYRSLDGTMVFCGRQYPFNSAGIMDFIIRKLLLDAKVITTTNLYEQDYQWTGWVNSVIDEVDLSALNNDSYHLELAEEYIPISDKLVPISTVITDAENSYHYNDVLYSSCSKPLYAFKYFGYQRYDGKEHVIPLTGLDTKCVVGGTIPCLDCGTTAENLSENHMRCEHCQEAFEATRHMEYCFFCDRRLDEMHFIRAVSSTGETRFICKDCLDNHVEHCPKCGEFVLKQDMRYVDEHGGIYICEECYDNIYEEE